MTSQISGPQYIEDIELPNGMTVDVELWFTPERNEPSTGYHSDAEVEISTIRLLFADGSYWDDVKSDYIRRKTQAVLDKYVDA